jgi:hypothetical protein
MSTAPTAQKRKERSMHVSMMMLLLPLVATGCVSYSNTARTPPQTTIVVPQGSTVYCSNGLAPPCR